MNATKLKYESDNPIALKGRNNTTRGIVPSPRNRDRCGNAPDNKPDYRSDKKIVRAMSFFRDMQSVRTKRIIPFFRNAMSFNSPSAMAGVREKEFALMMVRARTGCGVVPFTPGDARG